MKVTNNFGYPEPIYNAIVDTLRPPVEKVLHVTELLQPPQITALTHHHWDELVVDASEMAKSFLGISMHKVLQNAEAGEAQQEHTITMKVLGYEVTGTSDLWINKWIKDYKFTSAWTFVFNPGGREEWYWQGNCYAELARQEGKEVLGIEIIPWLYDWSAYNAKRDKDYPQNDILSFEMELVPREEIQKWIKTRVRLHKKAIEKGVWPKCTKDDKWQRDSMWAVRKEGGKRAIKNGLFDDQEGAQLKLKEMGSGYEIEHRPAARIRCERFCNVRGICPQKQQEDKLV